MPEFPSSLPDRRHASVVARMTSLSAELAYWMARTADDTFGLGRHHSQVRRLETTIGALLAPLEQAVAATPSSSTRVLDLAEDWEKQVLAAHSIWEIFRSKLVVREIALFRRPLAACDDLAWACYEPALQALAPGLKGPPLVFLSATWSPFAQSRDANFLADVRASPGTTSALTDDTFQKVLNKLPIPLVGLPWYQTFHMPGAILVAHEVGHIVESDFALRTSLAAAIDRAAPRQAAVWHGWASEIFADVYGTVTMGPAFVGALIDFLSTSVVAIKGETRRGGKYPTRALRVEIVLNVLVHLGHATAADSLRAIWHSVYGPIESTDGYALTIKEFAEDAGAVARAVCDGPYGGPGTDAGRALQALPDILPDTGPTVGVIARLAARGQAKRLEAYADTRQLFAAAQWLHEHPQDGQSPDAFALLIDQIVRQTETPVRRVVRGRGRGAGPADRDAESAAAAREAARLDAEARADAALGHELLALLT